MKFSKRETLDVLPGRPDCCWVYVIAQVGDGGACVAPVKIGISSNTDSRLETIQTSCPFKIDMPYVFECPNRSWAELLERCFHETQRNFCLHGEWFNFSPLNAIYILCIGYRMLLAQHVKDVSMHVDYLDVSGVLWAEKRFGLIAPGVLNECSRNGLGVRC